MSAPAIPIVSAAFSVAGGWLCVLSLVERVRAVPASPLVKIVTGLATLLVMLVPVGGLPLWAVPFSLYPNPSLIAFGLVSAALWNRLFNHRLLRPADWQSGWIFGVVSGSALYLHRIFFGKLDLYFWGWDRDPTIWSMAALGVGFLAFGNRVGILFLGALVAFSCNALESANGWDYLIDPFYWLASLGVFSFRAIFRIWGRSRPTIA